MEPRWLAAYTDMLPRIEAEEALTAAQVELLPHQKNRDRKSIVERWEKEARSGTSNRQSGKQYDKHGREVVESIDEFNAFLRSMNVI